MRKFTFCLFSFFLLACQDKGSNNTLQGITFDQLEIPLLLDFNPDRVRSQYYESDSGEFLVVLNKTRFSLGFFSIEERRLVKSIPLTKEGPNGIGLDNGFLIISEDSILVATIPPKIRLLNSEGKLLRSYPVENKSNDVNYISSTNEVPFLYSDKTFFGIQPFIDNFFEITEKEATSIDMIFSVDFSKADPKADWLPIKRPSGFWDEGKKDENLSWTERGDSIIIAPYTDHGIWIISKKQKKLLQVIECKSSFINEFHLLDKNELGGDKGIIQSLERDRYEIIMYDKYRDVFYRMFFPRVEIEKFDFTARQLFANRPLVGVMVMDKEFNLIGEHLFQPHYVQPWNYFVGKKGLYVSTNNPNRDDFDENFLRYDIIRFEGLKYED
ncbi:DUF4221 family protein [Algoriphagus confluentis]